MTRCNRQVKTAGGWKRCGRVIKPDITVPAPPSITVDAPVGPFTEIDGAYGSDYGANWNKTAADAGVSREFKKLYYHDHRIDNLIAIPWNGSSTDVVPLNNPIVVEDCKFYNARQNVATTTTGSNNLAGMSGSGTINVTSASSFPSSGSLRVGLYIVYYTGKTSTTFTGCTVQGAGGTVSAGSAVNKSLDGTGEFNLQIGGHATVNRVDLRNAGWTGLWTGGIAETTGAGCYQSTFQNMSITDQRIGIYCEHDTIGCTFSNFEIEASVVGVNMEWWYRDGPSNVLSGSYGNVFENFDIDMTSSTFTASPDDWLTRSGWGIWLSAGSYGNTIRNGVIRGGNGIRLPSNRVSPGTANTVTNVVDENGDPVRVYYDSEAYGT